MKTYYHVTPIDNVTGILKKGLIPKSKRARPTFLNNFGADLRKHVGVYAFEYCSDALMFAFSAVAWKEDRWVIVRFHSAADSEHDLYCEGQERGKALVLKDPVKPENICAVYRLGPKGFYRAVDGHMWHSNIPATEDEDGAYTTKS